MDSEGNVKPPREREVRIVLDDVPEDEAIPMGHAVTTQFGTPSYARLNSPLASGENMLPISQQRT
jgi:predicted  nucleic acid-binding Zn ribbon protein